MVRKKCRVEGLERFSIKNQSMAQVKDKINAVSGIKQRLLSVRRSDEG
jgi:hypothetical protein